MNKQIFIKTKELKVNISNKLLLKLNTLFFIILSLFTFNCSAADKIIDIRVALSTSPLSSPFIIAKDQGYFKEENINIIFNNIKGGHLAMKRLLAGDADIATSSEAVVMFNSFKRNDFSLFCTFVTSDNDVKIISQTNKGINNIEDLKGKKIGTILGSSAHFFLSHTLLMNGIDESDVEISAIKAHESYIILQNDKLDAVVTWEPYAYQTQQKLGKLVKNIEHERVYTETFNAITMREYAKNNTVALSKVVTALSKATKYIKAYPKKSQLTVSKYLDKDLLTIKSTWNDFSFAVSLNQWLLTIMESEARWAIEHGFIKKQEIPDYLDFINTRPLEISAPKQVNIFR